MLLTLALHALAAAVAPALAARLGRRVFVFCAVAPAATLAWAVSHSGLLTTGGSVAERLAWVPALDVAVAVRVDGLSLLMLAVVEGIGVLVLLYSATYFGDQPGLGGAAGALTVFAGAMAGLVVADNLFLLFVFWELTSISSYVLIGFDHRERRAREAAQHALLVTAGGGLAMLAGFVLIGQAAGTYTLNSILATPPDGTAVGVGLGLVLVGAFTKSAQVPFHGWLAGAMVAPSPVSAYLHAASMVKAGVYLIARFAPAFAGLYGFWRPLVVGVGLVSLLHGAARALRQYDLKLLLAYGTVSQLGLMVALVGAGIPGLTAAGLAVILAHALYKAALFLVVGVVEHETGARDIRALSAVGRAMPVTFAVAALAAGSMMGLPPLLGYVAKESALKHLVEHAGEEAWTAAVGAVVAGAVLTVAYSARFLAGGFGAWWTASGEEPVSRPPREAEAAASLASPAVLAALTLVLGLVPALAAQLLQPAGVALDARAGGTKFKLWPGLTLPLGLSVLSLVLGGMLFALRGGVERLQARLETLPGAEDVFRATVAAIVRLATRTTAILQNGSLPVYLGVILATAVVLPSLGLFRVPFPAINLAAGPLETLAALTLIVAAVATARSRRRFVAVLYLGAVGYTMGVVFVLRGAPDLALTQFGIETLIVVVFVLVLRYLPEEFSIPRWRFGRRGRLAVSVAVGLFVGAFTVVATAARRLPPISEGYLERAVPEAGGHNVVNVILVDFRGLDTLGEITVLTVAALGVASLLAAERSPRDEETRPAWLGESRPSLVLRTGVAAIFPIAMIFSLFLLFAGHNSPGGGFVAGLVAGAVLVLRRMTGGPGELRTVLPLSPSLVLGAGLGLAVLAAAGGWLWGSALLESATWQVDLPLLGSVKTTSTLLFDLGVYVVVVGFVLMVLRTLGEESVS
ncbi:MAG: DUF4040 domain-containing protein [Actinomycetota bacterium]|nr:DUF4040 domain-containing protein [Actinomycetota bacterium]